MPVERVEWQCPQCQKRYAIPAHLPPPALCPKCQPAASPPEPPEWAHADPINLDSTPSEQETRASRYLRKYGALRAISLIFRGFAVLFLAATLVGFVAGVAAVFQTNEQAARWTAVAISLGSVVGGALVSVAMLAIAELIRLLLDIEQNTRRH